jgi:hypothetical protein
MTYATELKNAKVALFGVKISRNTKKIELTTPKI